MRTGTLTATGFVGPLTGVVNGVALDTGGVATNFLEATGNYSVPQGEVPAARDLTAGAGLTGGGTLAADRTFNVVANADGSIAVNADDIQVGVLATDAQHGVRGGGAQHSNVVGAGASGFMTGADKTILDALITNAVPETRDLTAGAGLTGGGTLAADRTFDVVANADLSIVVNANDIQVGVLATDAQHGVRGGGTQHSNVVGAGASGFMTGGDKTKLDALITNAVPETRDLTAGAGLTGGGTLAADRTFDVVANADLSIVVNANDIQVGVLATDAQHGVRGGGTQHSNVVGAGASGFMTGADKTLLDGLVSGSPFLPLAGGTIAGILVITGLKSGTISVPPGGLVSGELWEDTTDDASNPLVRIAA